jgi:hypothetical protein
MDFGSGHELASQLSYENFRRQIPAMSYEQRGELLEKLGYSHFVVQPQAARLMVDMHAKAPTDWLQTAGALAARASDDAEVCAESHW